MNNPIIQILSLIVGAAIVIALYQLFGGDVLRIVEVAWEWVVSLVNRIAEFFVNNESFRRIARGPNG